MASPLRVNLTALTPFLFCRVLRVFSNRHVTCGIHIRRADTGRHIRTLSCIGSGLGASPLEHPLFSACAAVGACRHFAYHTWARGELDLCCPYDNRENIRGPFGIGWGVFPSCVATVYLVRNQGQSRVQMTSLQNFPQQGSSFADVCAGTCPCESCSSFPWPVQSEN